MTTVPDRLVQPARMIRPALVGAILAVAALTAACGADSDGPEVATLGATGEDASATSGSTAPAADPQEAALAFARCMREHGVDMKDPEVTDGRVAVMIGPASGTDPRSPASEEALKACQPAFDEAMQQSRPKLDPEEEARRRENALAFARCMREHGVDMPDPQFEEGGKMTMRLGEGGDRGPGGPAPDSPAFQEAHQACEDLLGEGAGPRLSRGGPGGGASSGGTGGGDR